ncbi:Phosphotyrosyl phosphatase activator, PTPA [Ostreococcus tauri]|uniref:Serine/threonine-protein phosphatase 2A activator n=1 Tax=Ostreococcus tauri TaxID=70448 RepID=Q01EW5_OSTTA|nr:Phosphotyrosyl phosphatase activator, PTPA [Ostreococcus tauri]CAL52137.2 Phosphotyrosyl phosphatase activator, PTPA [Ostreococcus tauri]|eukprot:XP_003074870.1 Phosphotyrosyl phosphatase activator, PTPA [Ostreococcus tauri]
MSNATSAVNSANLMPKASINTFADMAKFKISPARTALLDYIEGVGDSLARASVCSTTANRCNWAIDRVISFLCCIEDRLKLFPRTTPSTRFGDPNFRIWSQHLQICSKGLVGDITPPERQDLKLELEEYLQNSFGNPLRLDYGTGHELNFVAFLCCLEKTGIATTEQRSLVALNIFARYTSLIRIIQRHFRLEPAGSHGVWGLDDYCFIPFLWGAAQLQHETSTPRNILDANFPCGGLFFESCTHVKQTKSGPLTVVSPVLASLSTVRTWSKVFEGLLKMYCGECLDKFQIMQHFHFGVILQLE